MLILAVRQLIPRWGNVWLVYSDNGSNFVGAERELRKDYEDLDDHKIQSFMPEHGGDWIKWYKNPPLASHTGAVWERQIWSVRAMLSSLLKTHGQSLDDKFLITLMTEVEGILDSIPLTVETMILQVFNHFLLLAFWLWNQRFFHRLQASSWSLIFIARDTENI